MSLNGVEVAAKISGKAAERLAVLIYAILKGQKRTRGKIRLTNMLKSGKELKVFAVKDNELQKFCEEAKKYGVLYCVLKDNNANDGLTDIMVRAEDASKINRIFERFNLATIDMASVKTEIEKSRDAKQAKDDDLFELPNSLKADEKLDAYLDSVIGTEEKTDSDPANENPTMAQTSKSRQSGPFSENKTVMGDVAGSDTESRPSVRKELKEIREEQQKRASKGSRKEKEVLEHTPSSKSRAKKEEVLK